MVLASTSANTALANAETEAVSQTPFSPNVDVSRNSDAIGNTSVPKAAATIERVGRSRAVKNDEKLESTHPTKYENEKILRAVTLIAKSASSPGFTNSAAREGPASSISTNATAEVMADAAATRLKRAFVLSMRPAP